MSSRDTRHVGDDVAQSATLVDLLRRRAQRHGDRVLYTFLTAGDAEAENWTYGAMDAAARRIASTLQAHHLAGERVAIMGPSCGFVGRAHHFQHRHHALFCLQVQNL